MIPVERVVAAEPAAVTLDVDGTLVRYERSPAEVLRAAFERVGVEPLFTAEQYVARFEEFAEVTDSMEELRRECFAALAREAGSDPAVGRSVAAAYADERDHANVECVPGAVALVDELADRGIPRAVVTNGPPEAQRTKLESVGLADRVGPKVFAGHGPPAKPDPEPFAVALRAVGIDPESAEAGRVVHVGDSPDDVAGAERAGLQAVRVDEES